MTTQTPVIEAFIGRDGDAWRLYIAPSSWCPPMLRSPLDDHLEAFPVAAPDLKQLDAQMWSCDAPYEKHETSLGGVEIKAKGRSATALLVWLEALLE